MKTKSKKKETILAINKSDKNMGSAEQQNVVNKDPKDFDKIIEALTKLRGC